MDPGECRGGLYLQAGVPHCQHAAIGGPLHPRQVLGVSVEVLGGGKRRETQVMVCFLTTAALNLLMQKWTKCPHPLPWSVPSPCTQRLARQLQLEGLETLDQLWGKLLEHSMMSHRRFGSPALRSPALAETDRCQEAPHTWSPYHPASCSSGTQAHLQPQAPPLPMHFNPKPGRPTRRSCQSLHTKMLT